MRLLQTEWLLTAWRSLRIPLLLVVSYLVLRLAFAALSERHGLGSPDGLSLGYLAVAAILLVLRVALLVVVPAMLAYRVVVAAVTYLLRRGSRADQSAEVETIDEVTPSAG
ncbi:hypothetical protein GFY24_07290 [Nocardia sp. SYP-A9097]|uniref:hypothetical protein n=1 Tax=Nocardia sp. SYP-A9097 TaxID=2663237 RepID=UPI00129A9251|nr:hypothetical protein [Nocardia sp. SYP-A9097]MRH87267.1 hypothetical protein [Nocardia sp. SYP-A9097]